MVGHTHEDIDQVFSSVLIHLQRTSAFTVYRAVCTSIDKERVLDWIKRPREKGNEAMHYQFDMPTPLAAAGKS